MENKKVAPEELTAYFGSKLDMYNVLSVDRKHHNNQHIYSRVLSALIFSLSHRVPQRRMEQEEKGEVAIVYFPKSNFYFRFCNTKMSSLFVCQNIQNWRWVRFGRWLKISTKSQYTFQVSKRGLFPIESICGMCCLA